MPAITPVSQAVTNSRKSRREHNKIMKRVRETIAEMDRLEERISNSWYMKKNPVTEVRVIDLVE